MQKIFSIAILSLMIVLLTNCDSTESSGPESFNLAVTPTEANMDYSVEYKAEKTGDGQLSQIVYNTNDGQVTVDNPSLPWTVTVNIVQGTNISLEASGTASNGSVTITAKAEHNSDGATASFTLTDYFSREN